MEKASYLLELKGISKYFPGVIANDHIDLRIKGGRVHAIIGENGAGKSTLMNMIAGSYFPDTGEIFLNGEKIELHSPGDAVKHGIGMVFQEFMLCPGLSILENIIMGAEPQKGCFIDQKKARESILSICEAYQFQLPLDDKVETVPVAVLQQVEIVKLLYKNANIIILDEPTSVLTPQSVAGLFAAIRRLIARGKTVLLITHKLQEVMEIAEDITVLKSGKVSGNIRKSEASEELLSKMMFGSEISLQVKKGSSVKKREVLTVKNLNLFSKFHVPIVKEVQFSVREGEIVGIAGIAGSGQKELADALMGLYPLKQSGKIYLEKEEITHASVGKRREIGIAYVAENRKTVGTCGKSSIWENVEKQCHDIVEDFSVKTADIHAAVSTLSGGNIQKLLVGREFTQGKKLMIIEDPTRGIDISAVSYIWKRILRLAESGIAILLISHELSELKELSDRILVMYDGRLLEPENSTALSEEELGLWMTGGKAKGEGKGEQ